MPNIPDSLTQSIRWFQTLVAPLIVGLFFGGIVYLCLPSPLGFKISIAIAGFGLLAGLIVLIIRVAKNKGPASFYSGKNGK